MHPFVFSCPLISSLTYVAIINRPNAVCLKLCNASRVWNALTEETMATSFQSIFCRDLKLWLFKKPYRELVLWHRIPLLNCSQLLNWTRLSVVYTTLYLQEQSDNVAATTVEQTKHCDILLKIVSEITIADTSLLPDSRSAH